MTDTQSLMNAAYDSRSLNELKRRCRGPERQSAAGGEAGRRDVRADDAEEHA